MKRKRQKSPDSYVDRSYRMLPEPDLFSCLAKVKDTDLHIFSDCDVSSFALELALQYRLQIEKYIEQHPTFLHSLVPMDEDILAPPIVKDMIEATGRVGVGPMAAVAGAIAEYVGKALQKKGCREIMVENGGDIFIDRSRDCTVAIFAGQSPLSMQVGIKIDASMLPLGVCTSSGTVGHSLSFGRADAVVVVAKSTAFADAVATRVGNEVVPTPTVEHGIKKALQVAQTIDGVLGVVVICGEKIGAVGDIELVNLQ